MLFVCFQASLNDNDMNQPVTRFGKKYIPHTLSLTPTKSNLSIPLVYKKKNKDMKLERYDRPTQQKKNDGIKTSGKFLRKSKPVVQFWVWVGGEEGMVNQIYHRINICDFLSRIILRNGTKMYV